MTHAVAFPSPADAESWGELAAKRNAALGTVLDGLQAIVYVADMQTSEILFANQYLRQVLGTDQLVGRPCWEAIQSGQTGRCGFCTNDRLLDADGKPKEAYVWEFQNTVNGRWYYIHDRAIEWVDGRIVRLEIATDITDRKTAEARLQRLTRIYSALNQCNQIILRCSDEAELFAQISRAAVLLGGMQMAGIGMVDPATKKVIPAASFGQGADTLLAEIEVSVDARSPFGGGLVGHAVRENRPVWCQDYLNDSRVAPWREWARRFGWGSAAVLPLCRDEEVVGCLVLYSHEVGAFDEAARNLLVEMANDVSSALDRFQHERARRRSDEALRLVAEELSVKSGEKFFQSLASSLVKLLDADYALVGELLEDEYAVSTTALVTPAGIAENMRYSLEGTPCSQALTTDVCIYPAAAAALFPDDALLAELGIEAYAGVSLQNGSNNVIGILAVMWRRPLRQEEQPEHVLRIFSSRAGAELTRSRAEEALHRLNEDLELRVQQRTEQLLAAKVEAENANLAKSDFLSSMSHELRTPLNAILGFSQLLAAEALPTLNADQRQNVDEIAHAGQHLLNLINEVLDLARIESGRLDLVPEPVDLALLVNECLALVRPQAETFHLRLVADVPAGYSLRVDRLRLRQVLLNLLSNAIKYNLPGGQIEVSCRGEGDLISIAVRDTGCGIAPEFLPRLFKPFERHKSTSHQIEGTGIGLALSQRIVEAMGGKIKATSEVGVGSVFQLTLPGVRNNLPSKAAAVPAIELVSIEPVTARQQTVLYVEDNPANLRLVQKILARHTALRLIEAPTAERGLELAIAELPNLILMDIGLPGMDGVEAVRRLRGTPATRDIPVIAISANAMPADIAHARSAGFDDYLTKPLDLPRFLAVVKSMLKRGG